MSKESIKERLAIKIQEFFKQEKNQRVLVYPEDLVVNKGHGGVMRGRASWTGVAYLDTGKSFKDRYEQFSIHGYDTMTDLVKGGKIFVDDHDFNREVHSIR